MTLKSFENGSEIEKTGPKIALSNGRGGSARIQRQMVGCKKEKVKTEGKIGNIFITGSSYYSVCVTEESHCGINLFYYHDKDGF